MSLLCKVRRYLNELKNAKILIKKSGKIEEKS